MCRTYFTSRLLEFGERNPVEIRYEDGVGVGAIVVQGFYEKKR
jgi:hypothetical protein